ncbi:MAG: (2Fe-2S)-binding protein [Candidatus Dormibacteraceae bacterium]
MRVALNVNGKRREGDLWGGESLLHLLREGFGLWGTKNACEQGECGSCAVLVDGVLKCSCLVLAASCEDCQVTTIEGLGNDPVAGAVQEAMVSAGGVQCGFCTPGFVVAMTELLKRHPEANDEEVKQALAGNLCRCTGYARIVEALKRAQVQIA